MPLQEVKALVTEYGQARELLLRRPFLYPSDKDYKSNKSQDQLRWKAAEVDTPLMLWAQTGPTSGLSASAL